MVYESHYVFSKAYSRGHEEYLRMADRAFKNAHFCKCVIGKITMKPKA